MKRLIAIGEALIDMIATDKSCSVKEAEAFSPKVGGAPANVCGAFAKLGGRASLITMLGNDAFGDKIVDYLSFYNVDCSYVKRTDRANTALAFVSRDKNGDRSFSFYRNPSADMLLNADDIKEEWFNDCFALHFCSVSLGDFPMKTAHKKAIEYARKHGAIISFDVNLRFNLWKDSDELKRVVWEFIPLCDILKISDDELEFLTGKTEAEGAISELFSGEIKLIILTKGADGACAYTKNTFAKVKGIPSKVVDTTGAGDAFIGSFLHSLCKDSVTAISLNDLTTDNLIKYLDFSNRYSACSVTKEGAIASYPNADLLKTNEID